MPPRSPNISRKAYELPLLKSLMELGGSVRPTTELYGLVESKMHLGKKEQEYDEVHARPKWVYELQWTRHALVSHGEMDGSQRGVWKITEKGRQRVRSEWSKFNVNDYLAEDGSNEDSDDTPSLDIADNTIDDLAPRFIPESLDSLKGQILIDDTPINQIVTIINANRNLIVTGPPGTGKTSIAINVSDQAVKTGFTSGYILTTATSDWSTFDTIGGYMPRPDSHLVFNPGVALRAIKENKWLIIDEINRADVDKAFGQLFTILSGQDVELPFQDEQGRSIKIRHAKGLKSYHDELEATYFLGDNWRIIGTMNTFDKNSLFALSYAFMRRFGFVHVNSPSTLQMHRIIDGRVQDGHLDVDRAAKLKRLLEITPREIGPAIMIDILNYLKERLEPDSFFESVVAYVLPQFEGLSVESIVLFVNQISDDLGDKENRNRIQKYLTEMFNIEPIAWETA